MNRRAFIRTSALVVTPALAGATLAWRNAGPHRFTFERENVLGTSFDLTIVADEEAHADAAFAAVLAQIDRDARILSGYTPDSEFSRWMDTRATAVTVSPELMTVLGLFDDWRARTSGAVDAATQHVAAVWHDAERTGTAPSQEALAHAVSDVRAAHWRLSPADGTATRLTSVALRLNSFTKSFIVGRAADAALAVPGVSGALVNVGGDLVCRGALTEHIGIRDPRNDADNAPTVATIAISNRAVATSGGYRRGVRIDGRHFSHIIDPRTGHPTSHVLSATVVASDPADAGALATAFCVLEPDESRRVARTVPGAEFLLVMADGRRIESTGWHALQVRNRFAPVAGPVAVLHAAEQDRNFELTIGIELAKPAGNARRPYVAVWIEDADKFPIRTLALWFQKPRWLPELRAWYRDDRLRAMAEGTDIVPTVSSATRVPGKYTFTWDGKDQQGNAVSHGTYTVCVELAREHGTYQVTRQTLSLARTPIRVDLAPNTELAGGWVDYHAVAKR